MFNNRWTKQWLFIALALILTAWGLWLIKQKNEELKNLRADQPIIISNNMILNSPAFRRNGFLPAKYTCDGLNVNPPLKITDVPAEAVDLVLIMDDPDAVGGHWTHWLVWNIPTSTRIIEENGLPNKAMSGLTDFVEKKYGGPCPPAAPKPSGEGGPAGTHHYVFTLYALDIKLNLPPDSDKNALVKAMRGHVIAQTELTGLYSR